MMKNQDTASKIIGFTN